jgi:hypothetical protein
MKNHIQELPDILQERFNIITPVEEITEKQNAAMRAGVR